MLVCCHCSCNLLLECWSPKWDTNIYHLFPTSCHFPTRMKGWRNEGLFTNNTFPDPYVIWQMNPVASLLSTEKGWRSHFSMGQRFNKHSSKTLQLGSLRNVIPSDRVSRSRRLLKLYSWPKVLFISSLNKTKQRQGRKTLAACMVLRTDT